MPQFFDDQNLILRYGAAYDKTGFVRMISPLHRRSILLGMVGLPWGIRKLGNSIILVDDIIRGTPTPLQTVGSNIKEADLTNLDMGGLASLESAQVVLARREDLQEVKVVLNIGTIRPQQGAGTSPRPTIYVISYQGTSVLEQTPMGSFGQTCDNMLNSRYSTKLNNPNLFDRITHASLGATLGSGWIRC